MRRSSYALLLLIFPQTCYRLDLAWRVQVKERGMQMQLTIYRDALSILCWRYARW